MIGAGQAMTKDSRRLRRQFDALGRAVPQLRGLIDRLLDKRMRLVRVPIAFLFMLGGIFSVLPVLGIWMLPLGVMLLAVDVPVLRPAVTGAMIRVRRVIARWRQRPSRNG
jgi:hypothetical protein